MFRATGVIGLLLLAATASAQQRTLTEGAAIHIGLSRDAVALRTEGSLMQAQGDRLDALVRPNPEFSYERESLDNAEDEVAQKLTLSQRFDVSGRRALHIQAGDRHLEAARYESENWRADTVKRIRERYYTALYQQKRRDAHAHMQNRIQLLNQALERRRGVGDVSAYDFQRASTERAALNVEVDNARVAFLSEWHRLGALLGSEVQAYDALAGDLLPDRLIPQEQLAEALDRHPLLRRLREQGDAYALQRRAESRTLPDFTLGLGLQRESSNQGSDHGLVLTASMPLPLFDKRQGSQARFHGREMQARSEYQLERDDALARMHGLWLQVTQYRSSARTFHDEAVAGAAELIEIAQAYYRAGEIGILELLDAHRGALAAELTVLELEYKARLAHIELDYLTGGDAQ
jgi:cobalt-zinc-cadmium efflux system outer membrane protein